MFRSLLLLASLLPYHSHPPLTDADEPKDPVGAFAEDPPDVEAPVPCSQWRQVDGGYECVRPRGKR